MNKTFSVEVQNVFSDKDYNDFAQLMFEAAKGEAQISKKEADSKIREVMFEILGVDEKASKKELRKAIRRHKNDVFDVIEETVDNLLVSGWGDNPFFNEYVETKNLADGDTNEFYVPDESILTVSELSGNHHDLYRQKLGAGKAFQIRTSWYGMKFYAPYELFMIGRIDWAGFINKLYEALDKKVNDMIYSALMSAGEEIPNSEQWNISGSLEKDTALTLAEDVEAATGEEVVIMGTRAALSKLSDLSDVDWISADMKTQRNTIGRIAYWEGYRLVELKQAFAPNDTTKKLLDNNKLLFMPNGDNRFIKLINEGDARIREITDDSLMDGTVEYEYQQKLGVGVVIGKRFGVYNITG